MRTRLRFDATSPGVGMCCCPSQASCKQCGNSIQKGDLAVAMYLQVRVDVVQTMSACALIGCRCHIA